MLDKAFGQEHYYRNPTFSPLAPRVGPCFSNAHDLKLHLTHIFSNAIAIDINVYGNLI
jgi:hypothetical protein